MTSEKPLAIIYTEGKTDWQHLKKAKEKLNLNLNISFYEYTHRMGDSELLDMCKKYARRPHLQPQIFIFDRDNPKIIPEVKGKDKEYKDWENNVFSFVIPEPEHRKGYENISIEFYYTDGEIKTEDSEGRRLFLTSEFDEKTGTHKSEPLIHVLNQKDLKGLTEEKKVKIVDPEIGVVKRDQHIALSKGKFTKNICNDDSPFDNFNFEPFRKIFSVMEEIIQSVQPELPEEELPPRFFIGREEQFEQFEKYLEQNKPISIEGLGGIGKTAFAEKCIERFHLDDRAIWFPCTRESELDSLIKVAGFPDLLKVEHLTERAKYSGFASLIEREERILFLDDFQEITAPSFAKFFQFADKRLQKAKIILIAREHPEIGVLTSPIHLRGLEDDNAFHYAKQIVECNYPELDINDQNLKSICQQFKGHPLAIELAIYLLDFGKSPENLLQEIVEYKDEEFLAHRLLDEIFNHPKSTEEEKEFMLAFSAFRGKERENAINFLFEGKNLTLTLRRLRRKLMLMYTDGFYETHPLVREFCYDRLSDKKEWHKKAVEYFKTERTEKFDPILEEKIYYHLIKSEQWQVVTELIRKKGEQFILEGYTDVLKEMIDRAIKEGIQLPLFYVFYGDIAEIENKLDEALNYYKQVLTLVNVDEEIKAESIIGTGSILRQKGELKDALFYLEKGYEICKRINYREGIAGSLNNIGLVFFTQGDLDKALEKHNEGLKIFEEIDDKLGIAICLNNIGNVFHAKGDFPKAIEQYEESLKIGKGVGYRSGLAGYLNNVGTILVSQGNLNGVLEKLQESLKIYEEVGNKSGVASSLNNIGDILRKKGDLNSALEKFDKSLKINEDIGDNFGVARSLNNIGNILYAQGNLNGAFEKYQESLNIQKVIGDKSGIATSLNNLGSVCEAKRDLNSALENYQEGLKLRREIGDRIGIIDSLNNLGSVLEVQKKLESALEKYRESLKIAKEVGDKLDLITTLNGIGKVLQAKKDFDGALKKYQESLKLGREIDSKTKMATSLNNIGSIFEVKGNLNSALEKYQESLKIREEIDDKSGIATTYHNLGTVYFYQKDYRLSLRNLLVSQAIQNQIGEQDQSTTKYIFDVRKALGFRQFKTLAQEVFAQLSEDLKSYLNLEEFIKDTTFRREKPKVGRNDPCPCGSGKKYKKCCGR